MVVITGVDAPCMETSAGVAVEVVFDPAGEGVMLRTGQKATEVEVGVCVTGGLSVA